MRLTELEPEFYGAGGDGITRADGSPVPKRSGIGMTFKCPCGCAIECAVPFANPVDGGPADGRGWERTGDTFDVMTLSPSILRSKEKGGCGWHGWIRNGEVISC